MNGRFFFGVLSGAVLISGGFLVAAVMFPVDRPKASVEVANSPEAPVAEPAAEPAEEPAPAAEPIPAPESVPAPEPEPAPESVPEPLPDPRTAPAETLPASEPSEPASDAQPEAAAAPATAQAPEAAPEPEPVTEPAPDPASAPERAPATEAAARAEPAQDAGTAEVAAAAAPAGVTAAPAETKTVVPPGSDPSPAAEPAPQVAELPAAPPATEPAAEASPEAPALAEAATAPEPPAGLDPPPADVGALPEAAVEAPPVIAEAPEAAAEVTAEVVPVPAPVPAPVPPPAGTAEPELELAEAAPEPLPVPAPAPEPAFEPAAEPAPGASKAAPESKPATVEPAPEPPAEEPLPQADGMVPGADDPALPEAEAEQPEAGVLAEEGTPDTSDSTFKPAPGLGEVAEGVIVGRLPRIGDASVEAAPVAEEAGALPDAAAEADLKPIVEFAATFENLEAKPILALVLIDPGTAELDRAGLASLPFPVSFALDPMDPATPERVAVYRAAGKEVVMLATGIAEGAQASDIEVAFQSMAQGLPEAVAVMDLADPLFQDRRPLASLVVPVVGAQGRGLLTWDRGLNAADQVARRNDVPAAVVFRDLGSAGTDRASIRRVLDRAVFKAGQDGRVAVAGMATPETVAALLEWSIEGKAATVALGPLTAVLTVE